MLFLDACAQSIRLARGRGIGHGRRLEGHPLFHATVASALVIGLMSRLSVDRLTGRDPRLDAFLLPTRKSRKCCTLPRASSLCFQQLNPLFPRPDCGGVLRPIGCPRNAHVRTKCPTLKEKDNDDPRGIVGSRPSSVASYNSLLAGRQEALGPSLPVVSACSLPQGWRSPPSPAPMSPAG